MFVNKWIYYLKKGGDQLMKRIYRSEHDRIVAGVLGGFGEYFNIDPTILRLLFVAGLLMSAGSLILIYLVAAIIIPIR